jgi:hypothetical protein
MRLERENEIVLEIGVLLCVTVLAGWPMPSSADDRAPEKIPDIKRLTSSRGVRVRNSCA